MVKLFRLIQTSQAYSVCVCVRACVYGEGGSPSQQREVGSSS